MLVWKTSMGWEYHQPCAFRITAAAKIAEKHQLLNQKNRRRDGPLNHYFWHQTEKTTWRDRTPLNLLCRIMMSVYYHYSIPCVFDLISTPLSGSLVHGLRTWRFISRQRQWIRANTTNAPWSHNSEARLQVLLDCQIWTTINSTQIALLNHMEWYPRANGNRKCYGVRLQKMKTALEKLSFQT